MKTFATLLLFHFTVLALGCRSDITLDGEVVAGGVEHKKYLEIVTVAVELGAWNQLLLGALSPEDENDVLKRFGLARPEQFEIGMNELLLMGAAPDFVQSRREIDRKNRFGQWLLAKAKDESRLIPVEELFEQSAVIELYQEKTRVKNMRRLFQMADLQNHVRTIELFLAEKLGEGQPYRILRDDERSAYRSPLRPVVIPLIPNTVEKKILEKYRKQELILGISPIHN